MFGCLGEAAELSNVLGMLYNIIILFQSKIWKRHQRTLKQMGVYIHNIGVYIPSQSVYIPNMGVYIPNMGVYIPNMGVYISNMGVNSTRSK